MDKLAHYTILDKIGEGGMGEVFRARDERLKREVAIKLLPEAFVADPERLARFEREAQLLASLQHPNVASIYGLEQDGGRRFLALELVPGQDLAQHLVEGAMSIDEGIEVALQIAAAVEAAHEMGIVHRDLKPSNVMLTPENEVKVLDFGLAKAGETEATDSSLNLSKSPTITAHLTEQNVILGTAAYMSPEQARGKKVDKRADIWSFGVILFEMLTGKQLFQGETISDTLAEVIKTELDFDALPAGTPGNVRWVLKRCLTRDPRLRLRDIGEARILLSGGEDLGLQGGEPSGEKTAGTSGIKPLVAGITAAVALAAGIVVGMLMPGPDTSQPVAEIPRQFPIPDGPGDLLPNMPAISPDGTRVAYTRGGSIWVRDLDGLEARHLERTSGVQDLFWSPDGSQIGYLTSSNVMSVDPVDGKPVVLAATGLTISDRSGGGGTWSSEHGILFAAGIDNIYRISDRGGDPTVFVEADTSREADLHEPCVLPDGSLLLVPHLEQGANGLVIAEGDHRYEVITPLDTRVWHPTWSPTGHILYHRMGSTPGVWAVPYDLDARRALDEPFLVFANGSYPSVAADGTLLLLQGSSYQDLQLVEADRKGVVLRRISDLKPYDLWLSLAPNDNHLATVHSTEGKSDIWIHDLTRGTETRLTFQDGVKSAPYWSPDGRQLSYYVGTATANMYVMTQLVDGSADPDTLRGRCAGSTFLPDGEGMLFCTYPPNAKTEWDIYRGTSDPDSELTPLVTEDDWQYAAVSSPDGKYFAYTSRETGTDQIFLKRLPDGSGKWQVSIEGGNWARWTADGKHLLYAQGDAIIEVEIETSNPPVLGTPRVLFRRGDLGRQMRFGWAPQFVMSGDGERFYFLQTAENAHVSTEMVLLQNWHQAFD